MILVNTFLCCFYRLFERVLLSRLSSIVERSISQSWAGFRGGRSTAEQVVALTSLIEAGFNCKMKTGAVFVDLSAAYDTVWRDGLLYKIAHLVRDRKIVKTFVLYDRQPQIFCALGWPVESNVWTEKRCASGVGNCTNAFQLLWSQTAHFVGGCWQVRDKFI